MSKGAGSKKKKSSPDPGCALPKIPRTPVGQNATPGTMATGQSSDAMSDRTKEGQGQAQQEAGQAAGIESLLLAMESRLAACIEKTSEVAREASALAKRTNEGWTQGRDQRIAERNGGQDHE